MVGLVAGFVAVVIVHLAAVVGRVAYWVSSSCVGDCSSWEP